MVGRGALIGTLQPMSSHCFPRACLHWGLLRGETYLDPLTLVGAGPVRLLPPTVSVGTGWTYAAVPAGRTIRGRAPGGLGTSAAAQARGCACR